MKIVHLSTTDYGGAYKATERIHNGLLLCGADSKILVRTKSNPESNVVEIFDTWFQKNVSKAKNLLNLIASDDPIISDFFGTNVLNNQYVKEADVIILHWVNSFISYNVLEALKHLNKKIIWVMHDMWLFTGGCHYDQYCEGYRNECKDCILIKTKIKQRIPRTNFEKKRKMLSDSNIVLVGPSHWMVSEAQKSQITSGLDVFCVYNPIDESTFFDMKQKKTLRKKYSIPLNKKIILMGATSALRSEKGGKFVDQIIEKIDSEKYAIVMFGEAFEAKNKLNNVEVISLGLINDEYKMREIYNCADVFVATSNQEAFGYTICESLCCGTPVVAFAVGGICDQIVHKKNGFLATPWDVNELINGIEWATSQEIKGMNILNNSLEEIGMQYLSIIQQIGDENE